MTVVRLFCITKFIINVCTDYAWNFFKFMNETHGYCRTLLPWHRKSDFLHEYVATNMVTEANDLPHHSTLRRHVLRSRPLSELPDPEDSAVSIRNCVLYVAKDEISARRIYPWYHKQAYIKIDCSICVLLLIIICRPGLSWCGLMSHEIKGCIWRQFLLLPLIPIISLWIIHKVCRKQSGLIWKTDITNSGAWRYKTTYKIWGSRCWCSVL